MKKTLSILSEKKGSVLVFFAVSLIVLTAMAGLALDVTHLYGVKSQLQTAADAAALAGASALSGPSPTASATAAATAVGGENYADTDGSGNLIPVSLHENDIICGTWNGTTFNPAPDGNGNYNAVEVVARRTGTGSDQPMVQNWLIKVLSTAGLFNKTGVEAAAVAVREPAKLLPIAVNEYWQGTAPYPESYMRLTDVDGSAGLAGRTFAVFGSNANDNVPPDSTDGFIDLSWRCKQYDASRPWYRPDSNGSGACSDCGFGLMTTAAPNNPTNGQVDKYKGDNQPYLFSGIPSGLIPPNAVYEPYDPNYPAGQIAAYENYPSTPSHCPYATIPHFSSSGNNFLTQTNLNGSGGLSFCQRWPAGSRFIVVVYDGNTQSDGHGVMSVTVVGYGVIQVDGYANGGGGGPAPSSLGPSGNTCYGHAAPTGVSGQADPYIVQPSPSNPTPYCSDFLPLIRQMEDGNANVRLVDPGLVVDNIGY